MASLNYITNDFDLDISLQIENKKAINESLLNGPSPAK
jgi:hypothetical protein